MCLQCILWESSCKLALGCRPGQSVVCLQWWAALVCLQYAIRAGIVICLQDVVDGGSAE